MRPKPNRRSIRLKGYDYSQEGLYFITICCEDRICRFGTVINGEMVLIEIGKIAKNCWLQIPEHFTNVILHEFVIMPNHIHGIIEITAGAKNLSPAIQHPPANDITDDQTADISQEMNRAKNLSPQQDTRIKGTSKTVGSIVRGFKIGVTKWARQNTDIHKLWQRNYHEHIIRDKKSYKNISQYIRNNPLNWGQDKFNS